MITSDERLKTEIPISYPIKSEEGIIEPEDPLKLDIPDDELVKVIDKRIEDSKKFFEDKYNLKARRQKNEVYLFGRQIGEKESKNELKSYENRYLDNALYEIETSINPLAFSKLPDLIVTPGNETPESAESAKNISTIVDSDIKKRENRRALEIAFKHLPVYFTGIIKARWDPNKGDYGDYVYDNPHPDNIVVDYTCTTNNADDMNFIAEALPTTVQDVILKFPDKKEEFLKIMRGEGLMVGMEPTWKELATPIKIWEVWFKWHEKQTDEKNEGEIIDGVIWKYKRLILKKMKDPNYDWEGQQKVMDTITGTEVPEGIMYQSMMMGGMPPGVQTETIYNNYFDAPRKPYCCIGDDQWGKIPYDETSRIEQNIYNQQNLDKRGKQINETLDDRGKHVFSKEGGLTPDDIEQMDMNDPNQDILVEGNVGDVHYYIQPARPTPQEFNDLNATRQKMFTLAGATNLNGLMQSDVATTNQIAREADYSRVDDLTEETVNYAAEWMAGWALQFIKLRYTQEHMRKILGSKGEVTFLRLKQDMIEDGMEVVIKASSTDKLKAQKNAMDMANAKLIDPLTFYQDMGLSDPEGRTAKLMMFNTDPMGYIAKYCMGLNNTQQMIGA